MFRPYWRTRSKKLNIAGKASPETRSGRKRLRDAWTWTEMHFRRLQQEPGQNSGGNEWKCQCDAIKSAHPAKRREKSEKHRGRNRDTDKRKWWTTADANIEQTQLCLSSLLGLDVGIYRSSWTFWGEMWTQWTLKADERVSLSTVSFLQDRQVNFYCFHVLKCKSNVNAFGHVDSWI